MLVEANEALTAGYDLIGLERISSQIGAVYRKRTNDQPQAELVERAVLVGQ